MKIIVPVQTRSRGSTQQQAIPLPPNHSSRHAWLGEVVVVEACLCLIKHWVRLQAPREAWGQWRCFGRGTLLTSEKALGTAIACVQCCIDLLNPSVVSHNLCIWTQIFDSLSAASSLSSGFSSFHREPKSIKRLKTREINCRRIRELPTSLPRLCHLILKDKDVTVKAARRGYSTPPPRR